MYDELIVSVVFKYSNEHINYCGTQKVNCEYCKNLVERASMNLHIDQDCKKVQIFCDYSHIGCAFSDLRYKMPNHMQNKRFRKQHIDFITKKKEKSPFFW